VGKLIGGIIFMQKYTCKYNKRFIKRFWEKADIKSVDGCWEWKKAIQSQGYGSVCIGEGKTALAHRVAYEITYGSIPEGLCVLHHCDNKKCVNPKHLFLGTYEDNNRDKVNKGRQPRGEQIGTSKLTIREVIRIRELHSSGNYSYSDLAKLFPVCSATIRSIVKEEYWKLPLAG
jgi:hypothetical protein